MDHMCLWPTAALIVAHIRKQQYKYICTGRPPISRGWGISPPWNKYKCNKFIFWSRITGACGPHYIVQLSFGPGLLSSYTGLLQSEEDLECSSLNSWHCLVSWLSDNWCPLKCWTGLDAECCMLRKVEWIPSHWSQLTSAPVLRWYVVSRDRNLACKIQVKSMPKNEQKCAKSGQK